MTNWCKVSNGYWVFLGAALVVVLAGFTGFEILLLYTVNRPAGIAVAVALVIAGVLMTVGIYIETKCEKQKKAGGADR